eukprot:204118_1
MAESKNEEISNLFQVGDTVQIIKLQTEKYNGQFATVVGAYLTDTKSWPVELCDNNKDKLTIKSDNLKHAMPISSKPSNEVKNEEIEEKYEEKDEQKNDDTGKFPVHVFVRMRQLVGLEVTENHKSMKYNVKKSKKTQNHSLTLKKVYGANAERDKKYSGFKEIIEPNCDNIHTFNKCLLPTCVPNVLSGENICVFAYGHTGSGKTHTIFGYKKENILGMYQLFARQLFNDKRIKDVDDIFVEVRFTELYQGKVYDLLSADKRECFIREDSSGVFRIRAEPLKCADGKIRAYPISHIHCKSETELLTVISDGIKSRNVGHSTLHDKSSRSHAFLEFELVSKELINARKKLVDIEADILMIQLVMNLEPREVVQRRYAKQNMEIPESKLKLMKMAEELGNGPKKSLKDAEKEEKIIKNKLNKLCNDKNRELIGGTAVFVDLAGNEYGRDVKSNNAQEQRERNEINKSLLALKECIRGLHKNKKHIVYRNSKLTMYLRKYLNGNDSKAIMISNIGSSQKYAKQTINTMQYSQLVAKA